MIAGDNWGGKGGEGEGKGGGEGGGGRGRGEGKGEGRVILNFSRVVREERVIMVTIM